MGAVSPPPPEDPYADVPPPTEPANGADPDEQPRKSVTTKLVELAERHYRVLLGEDGNPYAVQLDGPNVALPLRGRDGLRQRLARLYYLDSGSAAAGASLADALSVLEGAAADEDREPVALRLARHADRSIVLDLADAAGRCVIVAPERWHVAERSPILFRRTALTAEITTPVPGGDVEQLGELVNSDRDTVRLIIGFLVAALIPDIPHPILAVFGEQGTAKTTLLRLLAMLVDPSPAPTRTAPRDIGQWGVTASASWLVGLDNVSGIAEWLSDALCRAVTGDALTSRALYTDSDVSVIQFRRVLAMTSIDAGALRGDLGDRLLPVELTRIDPTARRTDTEISAGFADAAPGLLGALLDLLARVLGRLPHVTTTRLPRMADFARVLTALDDVTGWDTVADYAETASSIAETVVDSDPVALAIRTEARPGTKWTGTAGGLLDQLSKNMIFGAGIPRGWPKTAHGLSGAIRRATPALRSLGITVEHTREGNTGRRLITITGPVPEHVGSPGAASPASPASPMRSDQHKHSDAAGDAPVTLYEAAAPASPPASLLQHGPDQRKRSSGDAGDAGDARIPTTSRTGEVWRISGQPVNDREAS